MKKIINTIISIMLVLFFQTQITFRNFVCASNQNNFNLYVSMIKSSFNKKFDITLKGDTIPDSKHKLLYIKVYKYVKFLEKKNFKSRINIIITYSSMSNYFKLSYVEQNIFENGVRYV